MKNHIDNFLKIFRQSQLQPKTLSKSPPLKLLDEICVADIRLVRSPQADVFATHNVMNKSNEIVGSVSLAIAPDEIQKLYTSKDVYPPSWYDESGNIKNFLEIEQINTLAHQGQGFGRKIMQAIFKMSEKLGFEGRINAEVLDSAKTYYSKCGFDLPMYLKSKYDKIYQECLFLAKEKNMTQDEFQALLKSKGIPEIINGKYNAGNQRFFNPTEENIRILFGEKPVKL